MALFLDFMGFTAESQVIFKELAFSSADGVVLGHYIFKPPYPFSQLCTRDQTTNAWLSHSYHLLDWMEGDTKYNRLELIFDRIGRHFKHVYVRGLQKIEQLKPFFPKTCIIHDVKTLGMPSSVELSVIPAPRCLSLHLSCALANVVRMKIWSDSNLRFKEDGSFSQETLTCPDTDGSEIYFFNAGKLESDYTRS